MTTDILYPGAQEIADFFYAEQSDPWLRALGAAFVDSADALGEDVQPDMAPLLALIAQHSAGAAARLASILDGSDRLHQIRVQLSVNRANVARTHDELVRIQRFSRVEALCATHDGNAFSVDQAAVEIVMQEEGVDKRNITRGRARIKKLHNW